MRARDGGMRARDGGVENESEGWGVEWVVKLTSGLCA